MGKTTRDSGIYSVVPEPPAILPHDRLSVVRHPAATVGRMRRRCRVKPDASTGHRDKSKKRGGRDRPPRIVVTSATNTQALDQGFVALLVLGLEIV